MKNAEFKSTLESQRLAILRELNILDSPPSDELDRITRIACQVFDIPIALVSLIDCDRQWFKSRTGLEVPETARDISFCTHAVEADATFVVRDALADARFIKNPLVTGEPAIRFYAGRPLRSLSGVPIGTLCIIDRKSREFSSHDEGLLDDLATMAEHFFHSLESHQRSERARHARQRTEALYTRIVEQASVGIALLSAESADGTWLEVNAGFAKMLGYPLDRMRGMRFEQITYADDLQANLAAFESLIAGKVHSYNLEKRFIRADGKPLWVEVSVSRLTDSESTEPRFVMVVSDIDARKKTELKLVELGAQLEAMVIDRTSQLNNAVASLAIEAQQRRQAEMRASSERERLRATLENATDAFIEANEDGRIQMWNRSAEQTFGWRADEVIGKDIAELIVPLSQRSAHQHAFTAAVATQNWSLVGKRIEMTAQRRSGELFPVEMTLAVTSFEGRSLVSAFIHDISKRKQDEQTIRVAATRLKTITDNIPALIGYLDDREIYRFHNSQHETFLGVETTKIANRHVRHIFGNALYSRAQPYIQQALSGDEISFEFQSSQQRGSRWFSIHLVPDRQHDSDGAQDRIAGAYMLATDITDRKRGEHRLRHAATHDFLTGLPNRRAFVARLDEVIIRARAEGTKFAVIFIDLDDFKQINDRCGHDVGDALLREFAKLARDGFRTTDFVARLAGDEFVAVVEDLPASGNEPESILQRLREKLDADLVLGEQLIRISASIGAAVSDGTTDSTSLLRRADQAMYRAKQQGKNQTIISQ
ncbi:Cyclic di-GMP phosphodiesterase Gmr [Pandoraea eparura]|uniref:Cyclic di-GMP phosphodiesterase Gmr n=1 Tax=Pandoraea eparura TaxID=2508291 RepID=A0A5E4RBU8_9BURK|nr:PAS domain S-box protein [Pandoraea eparura]VVD60261.1 Cyclic di-GMP phosphodiesterase Gmr [Pandoraea eparura]